MPSPFRTSLCRDGDATTVNGAAYRLQAGPRSNDHALRISGSNRRFEIRGEADKWTGDGASARLRSELRKQTTVAWNQPTWCAADILIEPGPLLESGNGFVLWQYHHDDTLGPTAPALALMVVSVRGEERIGFFDEGWAHFAHVPFVRGQRYRCASLFIDTRGETTGTARGWVDGKRIFDATGIVTGHAGAPTPSYHKFGLYQTKGMLPVILHVDNLQEGPAELSDRIALC